ncbi:MAG: hypothetical protein UX00_C0002G0005 [Microgenomates group bacterium GW2011_GWB1_45_17]|nr:MAG: hypothetical protein UX00_C0002G0005 [Microgenomates group bacterium GW2011_GWB1_45_17]
MKLLGRKPSVKMARRVGGGTRRATFENQSVFFRKEPTVVSNYIVVTGLHTPSTSFNMTSD